MATFGPASIAADADNGYDTGGVWTAAVPYIGFDGASVNAGLCWLNVTVPQNATITSATIKLTPRALTGTITNVHGTFAGHKGDAPTFSNGVFSPNVGFTATTATVAFEPTIWTINSADQYVATVTTIVQEIVNGTWASGNDMAFRINDNSSTANNFVSFWRFNDGEPGIPHLTIDYTEGAPAAPHSMTIGSRVRPNAFAPGFGR